MFNFYQYSTHVVGCVYEIPPYCPEYNDMLPIILKIQKPFLDLHSQITYDYIKCLIPMEYSSQLLEANHTTKLFIVGFLKQLFTDSDEVFLIASSIELIVSGSSHDETPQQPAQVAESILRSTPEAYSPSTYS